MHADVDGGVSKGTVSTTREGLVHEHGWFPEESAERGIRARRPHETRAGVFEAG